MGQLTNQVVLITGCSSGIGLALARALADRGHRVFASARRAESIRDLADAGFETVQLDVTDPASIGAAVDAVIAEAGRIDMLVNNAGFGLMGPAVELPIDDLRRQLETNVTGPLALCQKVVPLMVRTGGGRIVNVESVMSVLVTPFAGAYCASKAALASLSEAMRMELAPLGIAVISVQPGGVRSRFAETAAENRDRAVAMRADSLYAPFANGIEKRVRASQKRATDAEPFARTVADAVMRTDPPRLVRAGAGACTLPLIARFVPAGVREWLLQRKFGLK